MILTSSCTTSSSSGLSFDFVMIFTATTFLSFFRIALRTTAKLPLETAEEHEWTHMVNIKLYTHIPIFSFIE